MRILGIDGYFGGAILALLWVLSERSFTQRADVGTILRGSGFRSLLILWKNHAQVKISNALGGFGLRGLIGEAQIAVGSRHKRYRFPREPGSEGPFVMERDIFVLLILLFGCHLFLPHSRGKIRG
jgi:hypothetical protein